MPELCAAVEEEEPEEPVELVAALVVAAVPEVDAPDCAATAACVNAASKLEKRLVPEADCPSDAVEFCAAPVPVAPGERWGGDCRAMQPLKLEMALIDIMQFLVANESDRPASRNLKRRARRWHGSCLFRSMVRSIDRNRTADTPVWRAPPRSGAVRRHGGNPRPQRHRAAANRCRPDR